MLARLIKMNDINDIYSLLDELHANHHIELRDKNGETHVKTDIDELAKHLLVADDGNTYYVRAMPTLLRDIQTLVRYMPDVLPIYQDLIVIFRNIPELSRHIGTLLQDIPTLLEDGLKIPKDIPTLVRSNLLSHVTFLTATHTMSINELRQANILPQHMLSNTPLAQTLASIHYVKGSQDCLSVAWPQSTQRSMFPMTFPVITTDGYSYDRYDIQDWLNYCKETGTRLRHPNANHAGSIIPLSRHDLIDNKALHDLIRLNVQLSENRKLRYLARLANGKMIHDRRRVNTTLKKLRKVVNDYELSLLQEDRPYSVQNPLRKRVQRYEELLTNYPELKGMDLNQLKNKLYVMEKEHLSNYVNMIQLGILVGIAGFFSLILAILTAPSLLDPRYLVAAFALIGSPLITYLGSVGLDYTNKMLSALKELIALHSKLARYPAKVELYKQLELKDKHLSHDLQQIAAYKQKIREQITDLHSMAEAEVWEGVLCLIETGVDVNKNNLDGSVLLSAMTANRWDVVTALVENGLMINDQNQASFFSALKIAIDIKDWEKASYLIKQGALYPAQNEDKRKELKTKIKEAGKWTELSASNRFFKAKHRVMRSKQSDQPLSSARAQMN